MIFMTDYSESSARRKEKIGIASNELFACEVGCKFGGPTLLIIDP
jgi:hypothetical protein